MARRTVRTPTRGRADLGLRNTYRRTVSTDVRVAVSWLVVLAAMPSLALWWWTSNRSSSGTAYELLTGLRSPFETALETGAPGVLLSVVGFLLVPASIGGVAAIWLERGVTRRKAAEGGGVMDPVDAADIVAPALPHAADMPPAPEPGARTQPAPESVAEQKDGADS